MKRIVFIVCVLCHIACVFGQAKNDAGFLPVSTPEAQGVSSVGIAAFLDGAKELTGLEMHGFVLLRHGKTIAKAAWKPYETSNKHTLYSVSKSFTATAIGLAIHDGKLKLSDKVISFFPDDLPGNISPYLAQLCIRDLLTMTMGQNPEPAYTGFDNWVKPALAGPVINEPGTRFLYNNLGPFLLSAILQKVTGQKIIDYLRPGLFEPLGITDVDYETNPQGINVGGYGLRLSVESMAKFGQLYLQKGKWNGRQLIPEDWVTEATKIQIDQGPSWVPAAAKQTSDWSQGYGYFFWRCNHNAYRADGAMGQFIVVMPEQDAVVAITSNTSDMQAELNLVWKYLLPAMKSAALPENPAAQAGLKKKIAALKLPGLQSVKSEVEYELTGKTFALENNPLKLQKISFWLDIDSPWKFILTDSTEHSFTMGEPGFVDGLTDMPGPSLTAGAKNSQQGLAPFKIAISTGFSRPHTIDFMVRYVESVHTQLYRITATGKEEIVLEIPDAIDTKKKVVIKGTLVK